MVPNSMGWSKQTGGKPSIHGLWVWLVSASSWHVGVATTEKAVTSGHAVPAVGWSGDQLAQQYHTR